MTQKIHSKHDLDLASELVEDANMNSIITPQVITWTNIRNPRYGNAANTIIICEAIIDYLSSNTYMEITLDPTNDPLPHIQDMYDAASTGDYGTIAAFTTPSPITVNTKNTNDFGAPKLPEGTPNDDVKYCLEFRQMRKWYLEHKYDVIRNNTNLWDALSAEKQQEWEDYRQALLDLPANNPNAVRNWDDANQCYGDWENLTLPTIPE